MSGAHSKGGPAGLSAGIYPMRAALKTVLTVLIEKGLPEGQVALKRRGFWKLTIT
jgi:thioredoxin reductase